MRSCRAPLGAPLPRLNLGFAGVFDSYRAHQDPLEQAETRMAACVRRARDARDERAVPPPVPPPTVVVGAAA